MNIALIFAGGTGTRMNNKTKPKQFLEMHGKPIIIHTLEVFQNSENIDAIAVVCIKEWIPYLKKLIKKASLDKVEIIVSGGDNTQQSQFYGLNAIKNKWGLDKNHIVLIHDGVRPLIDEETILNNINSVKLHGTAITVTPAIETIIYVDESDCLNNVLDRKKCRMAKAPQSFYLKDIYNKHLQAIEEKKLDFIDSACMLQHYGVEMHTVDGAPENIKITTPSDYYIFRAIYEARENSQIFGI